MSSLALAGLGVPVGAVFTLLVFALRAWVTKRREDRAATQAETVRRSWLG